MGMQGVLLQIRPAHRLLVSINMPRRKVFVELDASWVRPIDNEPFTQEPLASSETAAKEHRALLE
jgi:hypothetical protein